MAESYFESPDFLDQLRQYERAVADGEPIFMDSDELCYIADYYAEHYRQAEADRALDLALHLFPDSVAAVTRRAQAVMRRDGNTKRALSMIRRIDDTSHPDYVYTRLDIFLFDRQVDEAIAYAEKQYALADEGLDSEDFCLDVATLFADYELFDEAEKWLKRSGIDADDIDFVDLHARILLSRGEWKEAKESYTKLLDINPYSAHYWNQLSMAQYLEGDFAASRESAEYALAIEENNLDGILNRANACLAQGDYTQALAGYQRYADISPTEEVGPMFVGITLLSTGRYAEGLVRLREAELLSRPDSTNRPELYKQLAFACSHEGLTDEALIYCDRFASTHVESKASALVLRGHVLLEAKRFYEATRTFYRALKEPDGNPYHDTTIMLHIAVSVLDNGYAMMAMKILQKMILLPNVDNRDYIWAYMARCAQALNQRDLFLQATFLAVKANADTARRVLADLFPEGTDPHDYSSIIQQDHQ